MKNEVLQNVDGAGITPQEVMGAIGVDRNSFYKWKSAFDPVDAERRKYSFNETLIFALIDEILESGLSYDLLYTADWTEIFSKFQKGSSTEVINWILYAKVRHPQKLVLVNKPETWPEGERWIQFSVREVVFKTTRIPEVLWDRINQGALLAPVTQ